MLRYFCLFILMMSWIGVLCQATLVEFSDKNNFLNETGAVSASGPYPNIGSGASPSVTLGDVTIETASGTLFVGKSGDWSTLIDGHDIAISGLEHLNLDFASPIFALGYEMHDPGSNSTFEVTLKSAGSVVDSFTYNSGASLNFVGVTSSNAFDRAEIREISGGSENEYFGQFFITTQNSTSATSQSAVPEPSSLALMVLGLVMGLAYRVTSWNK